MIADEVMSGFGRTRAWFAVDHWGVVPDIITCAKGLTSSYLPLGVVGMRPQVAAYFEDHVFAGGLTYNSHAVCLAAALATIRVYEEDGLIELVRNRATGEPMARFNGTSPEMAQLYRFLLDNGVFVNLHWNQVMTNPPLPITDQELAEGFEVLHRALEITDRAVTG